MASTTTASIKSTTDSYSSNLGGYDCYPVSYEVHKNTPYVDPLWLGLAIIFGLLIGAVLALIVFRFCFRRWWEREFEEDRRALIEEHKHAPVHRRCLLFCFPFWYLTKKTNCKRTENRTSVSPLGKAVSTGRPGSPFSTMMRPISSESDRRVGNEEPRTRGMVDIALQQNMDDVEAELNQQDVVASEEIETDVLEKRKQISEKLVQIHMNQKSEGTKADREAIEKTLVEFKTKINQTQTDMEMDLRAQLEALRTDPDYANDEQKRRDAVQAMKAAHRRKLHVLFKDHLNALRESLKRNTKMSETEIDDILAKLRTSLAELETNLADVIQLQTDQLDDNFAQRQFLLEQLKANDADLDQEQKHAVDTAAVALQKILENGKIGEAAKEKLLSDLIAALALVREKHRAAVRLQLEQIGSKLRKQRSERLDKLKQQHNEQMTKLWAQAETITDTAQFLQAIRDLLDQQADEKAEVGADLDKDEAGKLRQAHGRVEQSWKEALQHETEQFMNELQTCVKLTPAEIRDMLRDHELELREWEKMRETEKKVYLSELRAKLDERKTKVTHANARKDSEQRRLTKQQNDMIQRVLEAQRDLDDGDRRQILIEHAHNQDVLTSMLALTKLRQERILARTLAERKSKFEKENIEKASENKKRARSANGKADGQSSKKEEDLDGHLANGPELEAEKELLLQELRDVTAVETKALVTQQDSNMASLIGRLQVGQARRQIFLERQDLMVKKMEFLRLLEHELKQQVQNLPPPDPNRLDELMKEHRKQVEQLNKVLDDTRQRQWQLLKERLEEKRLKTKKNLEAKFEAEEEEILTRSLKTKMSFASTLLCQNKLTARHQRALEQLELQTKSELERHKEQLNKQMQKELERTLLDQKKQFLSQLASICKMTPDEIKAMSRAAHESHKQAHPHRPVADSPSPPPPTMPSSSTRTSAPPAAAPSSSMNVQQSMPSNNVSLGHPIAYAGQPEGGGRLPPIERMGFRAAPGGGGGDTGGDIAGGGGSPRKRRKKKSKRIKQTAAPNDESDSV